MSNLYEQAESQMAKAMEDAVSRRAFGELLGKATENVVAMTKLVSDSGRPTGGWPKASTTGR